MKTLNPTCAAALSDSKQNNRQARRSKIAARGILAIAVLVTFCQACSYDFVNLDDRQVLVRNPLMNPVTPRSLRIWWTTPQFQLFDPVTATVRGGIASLSRVPPDPETGDAINPWVFHSVNVLLHLGVTLLVYQLLLCCRIRPWPACGGALLFAIHPVQVEPVVWITSIKDLLYGTFGLLAIWRLLTSLNADRDTADPDAAPHASRTAGIVNYLFATLCFVLAILSKPTAVILPLIALPLVWLRCRPLPARAWVRLGIWVFLAIPFIIIAKGAQPAPYAPRLPVWERSLVAGDALTFYLFKIVWPKTLLLFYGRSPAYIIQRGFIWWTWIAPAGLASILWLYRRRWPAAFAGVCIFAAGVLPVLGFFGFNFQYFSTVTDRYLYLSMFGIALIAASLLERLSRGSAILAAMLLAIFAGRSALQVRYWRDSLTLFNHVVENDPASAVAYANVANEFALQRNFRQSIECARRSIELDAHRCEAYAALGLSLDRLGRTDEALQAYRDGFSADPSTGKYLNDYAVALLREGDSRRALVFARLSVELVPNATTRITLGTALAKTNDWQGARRELEMATSLDPTSVDAQLTLATVLLQLGDRGGAIAHYQAALSMDPGNPDAPKALEQMRINPAKASPQS